MYDVISIISDNDLNVKDEEIVIETVFDWVHADLDNRKQHITTLFRYLRLPLLQPEYLLEVVEQNPLIQSEQECRDILEEAKRYHLLPARRHEFVSSRLVYRNSGDFEEVVVCIGGSDHRELSTRTVTCCRSNMTWNYLEPLPYDLVLNFLRVHTEMQYLYLVEAQNLKECCVIILTGTRGHAVSRCC